MNKHLLLFTFLLAFAFTPSLLAKNQFVAGYIITLKGDTVNGYLMEQSSFNATRKCVFKTTIEGNDSILSPTDVFGYRYSESKYYISKDVESKTDHKTERIFLEVLVEGFTSIYYSADNKGDQNGGGQHYYIQKEGMGLIELSEPVKYYDSQHIAPSRYKGKLLSIMSDCSDVEKQINKTTLNYSSLVSLAKKYNDCVCTSKSCLVYERKRTKVEYKFGALAGITRSHFDFGSQITSDYGTGFKFGGSLKMQHALFGNDNVDINIDLLLERESAYTLTSNATSITGIQYEGKEYLLVKKSSVPSSFLPYDYEVSVDLNIIALSLPIMVDYNFNFGNFSLHTNLGLDNKFIISSNNTFKIVEAEGYDYSTGSILYNNYRTTIPTYLLGGIGKIGVERKTTKNQSIQLNLAYEYLADMFETNSLNRTKQTIASIQLAYFW